MPRLTVKSRRLCLRGDDLSTYGMVAFADPHGIRPLVLGKRDVGDGRAGMWSLLAWRWMRWALNSAMSRRAAYLYYRKETAVHAPVRG